MDNAKIAAALFDAFSNGDADAVRALCSPELSATQNHGAPMNLDALIGFAVSVKRAVPDFRYERIRRAATPTGFVEEHSVCGTLPDGSKLELAACVVAEVRNGKVVDLREYLDTAAAKGLLGALSPRR